MTNLDLSFLKYTKVPEWINSCEPFFLLNIVRSSIKQSEKFVVVQ